MRHCRPGQSSSSQAGTFTAPRSLLPGSLLVLPFLVIDDDRIKLGSGERGAVPSGDGSDLSVDALPHQPEQISDDHIGESQEFVEWRDSHVLNLTDDLEEALDLRGGAKGDPQVSPKLQRGA